MTATTVEPTIARLGAGRGARLRLLCFPPAGAGAATFRPLAHGLPPSIELCALRLPGRESRRREVPFRRMAALVEDIVSGLRTLDDMPLALLGYCSGSFGAFELARRSALAGRAPVRLIVLASPGPRVVRPERQVHGLSRPRLLEYLRAAGISPESLLANPQLFELFEPAIRADFETYETWVPETGAPLPLPVSVIGARDDASVDLADLLTWQRHTSDEFSLRILPGGHNFLGSATPALARTLQRELLPSRDEP
jgi:surfactin synthase thioesterase subunit